MLRIEMCCYQYFVTGPCILCKLPRYLMYLLGCYILIGIKGLIVVIKLCSETLFEDIFRVIEVVISIVRITIYTAQISDLVWILSGI